MHVQQNNNVRQYGKMLRFSTGKILLLSLENLAQGKGNSYFKKLFILCKGNYLAEGEKILKGKICTCLLQGISMEMDKVNCWHPSE